MIVGATGGVGVPTAKRLYEEGMVLVLSARNKDKLEKLAGELGKDRVYIFPSDASEMSDVIKLFNFAKKLGDIDLVVSVVGAWEPLDLSESPSKADEMYDKHNKMFLKSAQNLAHVAARIMMEQKSGGTFIHFSSHAATRILPGNLSYSSAKAGARFLILNIAEELKEKKVFHVRFTDIQPSGMLTETMRRVTPKEDWDKLIPMNEITDLIVDIAESEKVEREYPVHSDFVA